MNRFLGLSLLLSVTALPCLACTGAQGAMGKPGDDGAPGTADPSVSAVTPTYGYLSRSVEIAIAGSGTNWGANTTVAFADPAVKVTKIKAASPTALVALVTIGADATVGATDVTITEGQSQVAYKGAFELRAPLVVTVDPPAGVPQGGLANIHVQMMDLTTPFDPDTLAVTLSTTDVATSQPTPTDYAFDITVEADVLAKAGTFDIDVKSGSGAVIDSPAKQSFTIAARTPTTLSPTNAATGNIATEIGTELFAFTPSSAAQQFVQFTIGSTAGELSGTVIPKSGKYADALSAGFGVRYGQGTTSTDPFFVVVADSNGIFGPGPVPADSKLTTFATPCTAVAETAEGAVNNDDDTGAQPVTFPALVSGTFGYGAIAPDADTDTYSIAVTTAGQIIHVATGGDPLNDTILSIYSATGTDLGDSDDVDFQEDLEVTAPAAGTYFVSVAPSSAGAFDPMHNTYQLFVEVK